MSRQWRPLLRALTASTVTSGLGISINIATDLKGNLLSWLAVAALTVMSGTWAGLTTDTGEDPPRTSRQEVTFGVAASGRGTRPRFRWGRRRTVEENVGIVMRRVIETRPDGTQIEQVDYFNFELASRDIKLSPIPPRQAAHEEPTTS